MRLFYKTYLSGSISQHEMNPSKNYWTKEDESKLENIFNKKKLKLKVMNPNDSLYQTIADLYDYEMNYISECDFILVDLSERRGMGVGYELQYAYSKNIPIYAILPNIGYYKNSETGYIHPFARKTVTDSFETKEKLFYYLNEKKF